MGALIQPASRLPALQCAKRLLLGLVLTVVAGGTIQAQKAVVLEVENVVETSLQKGPWRDSKVGQEVEPRKKGKLEPPRVITYSGDDILEELGPAHACTQFSGAVVDC